MASVKRSPLAAAPGTSGPRPAGPDFVEEYVALAERFAVGIARTPLTAPVPGCPGWSAYDLVVHLGNTHAWAATIVETARPAADQFDAPRSRRPDEVSQWYAGKAEDLYEVLRTARADEECWNFSGVNPVKGFWSRRQTHETLVHLVDLDQAGGRATPLDPELCADGVHEALSVFLVRMHARGFPAALTAPLTIRCADTGDAWTLFPRADAAPTVRPAAEPAAEPAADRVEGDAAAVLRLLWKRSGVDGVRLSGDRARVEAFLASRLTA